MTSEPTAVEVTAATNAVKNLPLGEGYFGPTRKLGYRQDVAQAALTAALPFIEQRIRWEIAQQIFDDRNGEYQLVVQAEDQR